MTNQRGKTTILRPLKDIPSTLLLESGTQVAVYKDNESGLFLSLEVRGQVDVEYKGEHYKSVSEFPEGLINLIKTEGDKDMYLSAPSGEDNDSCDVEAYVHDRNWLEIFAEVDGVQTNVSDTVDAENYTDEEINEALEDIANQLLTAGRYSNSRV